MARNTDSSNSSRPKLIRLLVILAIALGFVIYAYGWQVTDIDLDKPQEERRQVSVQNALRELLSPRIFEQEFEIVQIETDFLMICDDGEVVEATESTGDATITVSDQCGETGDIITVTVTNFEPSADARIRWIPPEGQSRPREILEIGREEFVLDANGDFSGQIEVPRIRNSDGQIHQVAIRAAIPSGPVVLSRTTENVIERMIETVFMALVATSIAIPIAALISFFAARNLMRPIRLSLGKLLVAFNAFAVGFALGGRGLSGIGQLGIRLGQGEVASLLGAIIIPVAIVGLVFLFLRFVSRFELTGIANKLRSIVIKILVATLIVFLIGTIAGLTTVVGQAIISLGNSLRPDWIQELISAGDTVPSLQPGDWLMNAIADAIAAIGNMLDILGTLVGLLIPLIASFAGAFVLSSVTSDLLVGPLRRIGNRSGHIIAGVLGFTGGAVLMGVMGVLGAWAALFGLLAPIVMAILGGAILMMIVDKVKNRQTKRKRQFELNRTDQSIQLLAFATGAIVSFIFTFSSLNVGRAIVNGTLPPTDTTLFLGMEVSVYVLQNMVLGAVAGGIAGLIAGVRATFPLGSALYNTSRTLLNSVRSIEPLIMGLVFVIWVGIGPFAGVLALTLHSIAALGKLYSEQIENIDQGPIEAIQSTGASWLQTVIYAVVPQIIPPYIAFTMYRWDINVRMSTIIGFVGGGGIGLLLQQQINLLQYRDAGVAVLAIAIVVSILDYASASIRERLV